jgi:hypothetical protein
MRKLSIFALVSLAAAGAAALAADAASELASKRAEIAAKQGVAKADLANEHYRLGAWAKERGLADEAVAEFKAAVAADPSHEAAHAALGEVKAGERWVGHDEAMKLKGLVRREGRWMLTEEAAILDLPAEEKARRVEAQTKASKLLKAYGSSKPAERKFAADALAGVDDKYKVEPFAWGLRSGNVAVRTFSAKELGRIGDRRGLRPLIWRALHDPDAGVRSTAVAAAKSIGDPNLLAPFVSAMWSSNEKVRANAATGVVELGDTLAVRYLVYRFEAHGGGAPRCYFTSVSQLSFIQDFDVEVAQTAFIADPIVGVIQDGIVLDVQVVATSAEGYIFEREVVHNSLRTLTGATEVKNEPGAWAAWWKVNHERYETASR